jgi:hypothetical protein
MKTTRCPPLARLLAQPFGVRSAGTYVFIRHARPPLLKSTGPPQFEQFTV